MKKIFKYLVLLTTTLITPLSFSISCSNTFHNQFIDLVFDKDLNLKEEFKLAPKAKIDTNLIKKYNSFLLSHEPIKKLIDENNGLVYTLDEQDVNLKYFTPDFLWAMDLFYFENKYDFIGYEINYFTESVTKKGQGIAIFNITIYDKKNPNFQWNYEITQEGYKYIDPKNHEHFSKNSQVPIGNLKKNWIYNFIKNEKITKAHEKINQN